MSQPKIIFKQSELYEFINSPSLISKILMDIANHSYYLPNNFSMIGIAKNVLLGVFGIEFTEDKGYMCYRMYYEHNTLMIANVGYPITNLGGQFVIDCEIDYMIYINTIKEYGQEHNLEGAI